ncbi:MAG: DUF3102 domain-containing protein [Ruminococcaceae bacterium]|nr:DUF3102 domain-containing protein [Oscillospiraceae bacterium]
MSEIITLRDIDIITTEIKVIEQQVAKAAIYGCIEIGKRLVEAKEMVGHGNWGKYLEEKVRYSQQWATNLMNLYKEYGGAQESLFESFANSQSFGNIDVTKHILLLSVPAEEREQFATEHDAEKATTRELQAAIRDRDANLQAANEQAARAEKAEKDVADLKRGLESLMDAAENKDDEIKSLQEHVAGAEKKYTEATEKVTDLQNKLKKAKEAEKAAKEALAKAQENPEIPESMMESMRQQVAADAAREATENLQKELDTANKAREVAERAAQDAEQKLMAAQKQLQLSSPEAAEFKAFFTQVQKDFKNLQDALEKVQQADPDTGVKLQNAVCTLLEKLQNDLKG